MEKKYFMFNLQEGGQFDKFGKIMKYNRIM